MSMKNSNDTIGNRTQAVPQATAPPRALLQVLNAKISYDSVLILVV